MALKKVLFAAVLQCMFTFLLALKCRVGTEDITSGECLPPCGPYHTSTIVEDVECPADISDPICSLTVQDERCVDGEYTAVGSCVEAAACIANDSNGMCMDDGLILCCSTDNCNSGGTVLQGDPSLNPAPAPTPDDSISSVAGLSAQGVVLASGLPGVLQLMLHLA
eukprot:gnl/TRDRNA2_/TRDRNA2_186430_c0_seq1.p1 gnl/TRDRNA2_/TRDRNA2_186430_c0~~gnl/TRDRNA2_/TRDRNA2_186430_c0_seq1.p1  ORF type:complete len:166 (+),score=9.83 gnl/TRDRNA2_/TRDRNA2_186430_c0_seq1:62-559(+)